MLALGVVLCVRTLMFVSAHDALSRVAHGARRDRRRPRGAIARERARATWSGSAPGWSAVERGDRDHRIAPQGAAELRAAGRGGQRDGGRASVRPATSARRPTRARRELFAAVSHDLRTPITSLRLLADAIDDDVVDDDDARATTCAQMSTHVRRSAR